MNCFMHGLVQLGLSVCLLIMFAVHVFYNLKLEQKRRALEIMTVLLKLVHAIFQGFHFAIFVCCRCVGLVVVLLFSFDCLLFAMHRQY
jgi:hypothetical protein